MRGSSSTWTHLAIALAGTAGIVGFLTGGGRATGWAVVVTAILAALAAACLGAADVAAARPPARPLLPLLALAIVGWSAVSLVSLPGGLLSAVAPQRALVERAVPRGDAGLETWMAALEPRGQSLEDFLAEDPGAPQAPRLEPEIGPPRPAPMSFAPWGTRRASLVALAFLMLACGLAARPSEQDGLRLVAGLMALATVAGVAGPWLSRAAPGRMLGLWEPVPGAEKSPYGAFWNPNHAAAFLALACPVLLAAAADPARRTATRVAAAVALVPVGVALLDVGSRGGLLAAALGVALVGVGLARAPGRRALGAVLLAGSVLGTALAFTVFAERIIHESFEETVELQGSNLARRTLYETQLEMLRSAPLVGVGVGAFATAHGVFRDQPDALAPVHGESDVLETLVEGGVPLGALWLAFLATLLGAPALRAARGAAPPLLVGLVAGALATLGHAVVDFHLREPVIALAAIGVGCTAAAWAARLDREASARAEPATPRRRMPSGAWLPVATGAITAVALGWLARAEVPRDIAFRSADRLIMSGALDEAAAAARAAVVAAPGDGDAWSLLGWIEGLGADAAKAGAPRLEGRRRAMAALVRALDCSPATFGAARRAAALLLQAGAEAEAARATRLALVVGRGDPLTRRVAGQLLLQSGPSPEAVEHFAFTFRSLAINRMHADSRQLTAWMVAAADGDPLPGLRAVREPARQAWYVAELLRLRLQSEALACIADLATHPPADGADALSGLLLSVPGPATADLARALLPSLRQGLARQRAGIALVRGGDASGGLPLVREGLEAGFESPEAWLALADGEASQGRMAEAERALNDGLARHPGSRLLQGRLDALRRLPVAAQPAEGSAGAP